MKILDKYIIKKVLTTFLFVVLLFVAIIAIIDVTEKIDKFARNNLGAAKILSYYLDFIPWIAGLITPIMFFIAIVYVTSRLAGHTEIIAILSSGVSFRRLLLPYFMAAFLVAIVSFYMNGWVIPKSNRERLDFELTYFQNKKFFEERNVHMQVQPNVYLFLQNYNNISNTGYQFTLERFEDNRLIEKLTADHIQWDTAKQKWVLKYWKHKKIDTLFTAPAENRVPGALQEPAMATPADTLTQTAAKRQRALRDSASGKASGRNVPRLATRDTGAEIDTTLTITPKDFENNSRSYDGMTIPELRAHIKKLTFRGSTGVQVFQTEEHIRYAAPFTIFVLVFMGVIVSARKSRGGTGFQIALGFLLSFVFILFFTMTRTFGEAGDMPPVLAAWLPTLTFAVIAAVMYKYVPR
ncbi:MAG: LptF/LptG family permease [Cyclobacteriaceae bacterium]|nr:LptF/LptG family permease [Cyclobacteriaceae bacterium]